MKHITVVLTVAVAIFILLVAGAIWGGMAIQKRISREPQPLTADYITLNGFKKDAQEGYFKPLPVIIIQQAKGADTLRPLMVMLPFNNESWVLCYAEGNRFVPVTVVSNRDQFDGWNETPR
jgi:hypothetical protein